MDPSDIGYYEPAYTDELSNELDLFSTSGYDVPLLERPVSYTQFINRTTQLRACRSAVEWKDSDGSMLASSPIALATSELKIGPKSEPHGKVNIDGSMGYADPIRRLDLMVLLRYSLSAKQASERSIPNCCVVAFNGPASTAESTFAHTRLDYCWRHVINTFRMRAQKVPTICSSLRKPNSVELEYIRIACGPSIPDSDTLQGPSMLDEVVQSQMLVGPQKRLN
ncbi:hypothetical protein C8R45DRAFT_1192079 [Mycena sanguinolenta]|nr:hypothetical protein C8R45DRAFT_1192079 [Mycena sanguinolenta]